MLIHVSIFHDFSRYLENYIFFTWVYIMDNKFIGEHTSKIAFLFVSFMVVAGGYVTQVLPCQTQNWLQNSFMGRHLIGWLICFLFIMLEGGWSFDMATQKKSDVDWASGNVLDTLVFGLGLYLIFLFTAKMNLVNNGILMLLLFFVYGLNAQRLFWYKRELITEDKNNQLIEITKYTLITSIFVFLYGIINYMIKKKKEYGKRFSLFMFFFDDENCHSVK